MPAHPTPAWSSADRMTPGFVFERAPFASAHASTIALTPAGLVGAWFGGPHEGDPEVAIWLARELDGRWQEPALVAAGSDRAGRRQPCWNPVLWQARAGGPLLLFYKVGPSPRAWWGMLTGSGDDGRSWSPPERLPDGILGPIKNKPVELSALSLEHRASWLALPPRAHARPRPDLGAPARARRALALRRDPTQPARLAGRPPAAALPEPPWRDRRGLVERRRPQLEPAPPDPNPDSGIDAVVLADGRALLVYNHAQAARTPLDLAVSDDGRRWQPARVLEDGPGEYSYPAVIQGPDRRIHITYTWNRRRIRYLSLTPAELPA